MKKPILVSIPHGGWKVAEEIKDSWALAEHDALHDGDPFTSHIYDFSDRVNAQITMEYYRAVVDLNRRPDDIAPANPDGVVKSHTCYNIEVYKPGMFPDDVMKEILLSRYYWPYHQFLDDAMNRKDIMMGVDCHSMAAVSPPIERDAGVPRPLICLGNLGDSRGEVTEPFYRTTCPADMVQFMADSFRQVFQHEDVDLEIPSVAAINVPFNGGHITHRLGLDSKPFVQIEMSRALYLNARYFDEDSLEMDDRRIRDLNTKVWNVLSKTAKNL